ncbi:hypothetical protein FRC11_009000 [Ceratobasidium sp. 423]|nr:hypothetical protein FRC11_009000 [Ceratobasidium sp. 423]
MLFTPLLALTTYASATLAGTSSSLATTTPSVVPTSTLTSDAALPSPTAAYASNDPNDSLLNQYQSGTPEPEHRSAGANIPGPRTFHLSYPGDLWYFPRGIPHSIQGFNDTAQDCEFLLVLDDGTFSKDSMFLLTDWVAHVPKEVLAKNFRVNASAFDHIPDCQLWMLPSAVPIQSMAEANPVSPAGTVPLPYTFATSKAPVTN